MCERVNSVCVCVRDIEKVSGRDGGVSAIASFINACNSDITER